MQKLCVLYMHLVSNYGPKFMSTDLKSMSQKNGPHEYVHSALNCSSYACMYYEDITYWRVVPKYMYTDVVLMSCHFRRPTDTKIRIEL